MPDDIRVRAGDLEPVGGQQARVIERPQAKGSADEKLSKGPSKASFPILDLAPRVQQNIRYQKAAKDKKQSHADGSPVAII